MAKAAIERGLVDRRAAIMAAALRLFADRGFYGTRVPDIAQQAGVGAGTIYRYFATKEALVNAIYREKKQQLGAALASAYHADAPFRPQCLAVWRRLVAFASADPIAFRFLEYHHHAAYLDEASRAAAEEVERAPLAFLAAAVAAGAVTDDLEPAELLALVWGALVGCLKASDAANSALSPEKIEIAGEAICRLLEGGNAGHPPR